MDNNQKVKEDKPKVIFVTGNKNKLKEVQAIIGELVEVDNRKLDCKLISTRVIRRSY